MPRELRKVIFSNEEVTQALNSYNRMKGDLLPQGSVRDVRIVDGREIQLLVTVEMKYGGGAQAVEIGVKPADVVELLVRGCLENNIPIPRRAEKSLALVDGDLALVIHVASEEACESLPAPSAAAQRPRLIRG